VHCQVTRACQVTQVKLWRVRYQDGVVVDLGSTAGSFANSSDISDKEVSEMSDD
jgi:hypothetical protein